MESGVNFYKLEIDIYIIEEIRRLSRFGGSGVGGAEPRHCETPEL
jgi:hypothetical protein